MQFQARLQKLSRGVRVVVSANHQFVVDVVAEVISILQIFH